MSNSKSLICNMALGHCGVVARIEDVDNEFSNEAIVCKLYFDHITEVLHETCAWPFATRREELADLGTPPDDWAYRYKYPTDCKLAQKIVNPAARTPGTDRKIPFEVIDLDDAYGKAILTDQPDAILQFNRLTTDVTLWSSSFVQAHSMGMAAHIAMPLRVDTNIVRYVGAQFSNWLAEAVNLKQRERQDDPEPQSEFATTRA